MAHAHHVHPAEPKTPFWFTALGGVLFASAGLLWALTPSDGETLTPPPAKPLATAAAAPSGSASAKAPNPETAKILEDIRKMQAARKAAGAPQ